MVTMMVSLVVSGCSVENTLDLEMLGAAGWLITSLSSGSRQEKRGVWTARP